MWSHIQLLQIAQRSEMAASGAEEVGRSLEKKATFFQEEIRSNQSSRDRGTKKPWFLCPAVPAPLGLGVGSRIRR